jgi:hypothetical protein
MRTSSVLLIVLAACAVPAPERPPGADVNPHMWNNADAGGDANNAAGGDGAAGGAAAAGGGGNAGAQAGTGGAAGGGHAPACAAPLYSDFVDCMHRIPDPAMPNNPNAGWQCAKDCHAAITVAGQLAAGGNLAAGGPCVSNGVTYCVPPLDGGDPCAACNGVGW